MNEVEKTGNGDGWKAERNDRTWTKLWVEWNDTVYHQIIKEKITLS